MSFLVELFGYEVSKSLEDPKDRALTFKDMLEGPQEVQAAQRTYVDMSGRRPNRYEHLRMNPFYEQRNKMFPHRRFVRRDSSE